MIAAVSFDAVGTLIVPQGGVGLVYAEVAAGFGVKADPAALERRFGRALASAQAAWKVPYGADEEDARRFWKRVVGDTFPGTLPHGLAAALFDTFSEPRRWRVLPGVRSALAVARARDLPLAVVSDFDCRLAPLLDGLCLGPFTTVVTSAAAGCAKPDPELLRIAARILRVDARRILHVGDSAERDGAMAAAAGASFRLVESGAGIDAAWLHRLLEEACP